MTIHCPICNRSSDDTKFIGEICEFCTADKIRGAVAKSVDMYRCGRCGNILVKGQYKPLGNVALSDLINSVAHVRDCAAKVTGYSKNKVEVDYECDLNGELAKFSTTMDIRPIKQICPRCYRISSGYYEALVQLRGDVVKADKIAEKLSDYIAKNGAFIAKMEQVTNGFDIYVSDKKLTSEFLKTKRLKAKLSATLATIKGGKKLYRNTYLLRII